MNTKHKIWLSRIRKISHKFIKKNFSNEEPLFEVFWQVFCFKIDDMLEVDLSEQLIVDTKNNIVTNNSFAKDMLEVDLSEQLIVDTKSHVVIDISFAKDYALDMATPIVLATVAETMRLVNTKKHSYEQLETLISKTAAKFGAMPGLTACLTRSLPKLCMDILTCDPNTEQANVLMSPQSKYRIFVNGGTDIIDSIDEYKKNKSKYLLWIDIDQKPKSPPDPRAINLLKFLVKNIGIRNSIEEIIREVYEDVPSNISKSDNNKIAQHLSQLNKYGKERFIGYLFDDWRNKGLGLDDSFSNKYFLFMRLA